MTALHADLLCMRCKCAHLLHVYKAQEYVNACRHLHQFCMAQHRCMCGQACAWCRTGCYTALCICKAKFVHLNTHFDVAMKCYVVVCTLFGETAIMFCRHNDSVSSRHSMGNVLLQPSSGNSSTHNYNANAQTARPDHSSRLKVCVARDEDFHDQIGSHQWFDLMDPEKVP